MIAHIIRLSTKLYKPPPKRISSKKKKKVRQKRKIPKKPKPYQPFSKIIDAFAMDEVQIFREPSAG
jgi:hypothetical protein